MTTLSLSPVWEKLFRHRQYTGGIWEDTMKFSLRGAAALLLLAGFYLLALGIVVGLLAVDVVAVSSGHVIALKVLIVTVPVIFAVSRGMLTFIRDRDDDPAGMPVSRAEQPDLWALVDQLAEQAGTRAPDEIRFVLDVNAAVAEQTRLLGLRQGKRRMFVGVPLLVGLTQAQLSAVLAHELGHYGNRDTRFAATTYRGREAFRHHIAHLRHDRLFQQLVAFVFAFYATLYFRVSSSVCRRQELAADAVAVRVAGGAAAASALRELPALEAAWGFFMSQYASIGYQAGLFPDQLMGGFRALLREPTRRAELDEIRQAPPEQESSPYDSHPPILVRIAAIEEMRQQSTPMPADQPAVELIRAQETTFEEVVRSSLTLEAATRARVSWQELVHRSARVAAVESVKPLLDSASRLTSGTGTLTTVLDLIDHGRLTELGAPLVEMPGDAAPRVRREMARTAVRRDLATLVTLVLVDAGAARWTLSWSVPAALEIDEPYRDALTELLDAAVADDGDTAGLRALLATSSADLDYRPPKLAATT